MRNGGDQRLLGKYLVDGYDAATRVSRLSVARVSALFPKATLPVHQNAPRSYPARNVRGHQTQTRRVARTRIPPRHQVGVRLGPRRENQRVSPNLFEDLLVGGTPAISGRLFRGKDQCGQTSSRGQHGGGPTNQVPGRHVVVPLGKKNGTYPVGHPVIFPNPEGRLNGYFGLAKVDILPPFELYHPVLPHRQNGKLTFPLCATCIQEEMPKTLLGRHQDCPHTAKQRTLRGTWCTSELHKAVEKGYTITKIHEVWHFPESQRRTGLFAEYVAEDQTGIRWLSRLGPDPWSTSRLNAKGRTSTSKRR